MPRPALRTGFLRRIRKKLPGGASIVYYFKKKPKAAVCARCKKPLHGVSGISSSRKKKSAKSKRKPQRPYGGNLCSKCARVVIKEKKLKRVRK